MNVRLLSVAIVVSAGGAFHFGFQLVITDPSEDAFVDFENNSLRKHYKSHLAKSALDDLWSVFVALYFCGAICGSLATSFVTEKLGRKLALIITYGLSFIAISLAIVSYFIKSIEVYAFSRVILGFSNALSLAIGSLYLSEITPRPLRGRVGMATGIAVQLGLVVGSLIAMPQILGTSNRWWIIYGGEGAVLIIALAALIVFPESPDVLARSSDTAAIRSVKFFHRCSEDQAIQVIQELHTQNDNVSKMGLLELWRVPVTRRRTFISMVAMFAAVFSGVAAINAFAVDILESSGLSNETSAYVNVGLAVISFISALCSSLVVDRYGRRPLLLISYVGLFLCNLFIGTLLWIHESNSSKVLSYCLIVFMALFLTFFAMGCGPLTYFIAVEMCDLNCRSAAQAWTSATQMASRTLLLAIFLPLKSALGSAESYLLLFVVPLAGATIFLYRHLPETKNKTQKELNDEFTKLPYGLPSPRCCC